MSDGGFLSASKPELSPARLRSSLARPELEMRIETAQGGEDEVALAEREAVKEMVAEEEKDHFLETVAEAAPTSTAVAAPSIAPAKEAAPVLEKDGVTLEVEKILEDGLGEYLPDMPEEARVKFIGKGGEVAGQVSGMVRSLNVSVKRVVELIKDWLLTIPGVNRYFIEQEAKIKTDRIVELVEVHKKERSEKST